jgi:type I restriction enzyme S subunit
MLKGQYLFEPMKSIKPTKGFFKYIDIDSIDNKRGVVIAPKILPSNNAPSRASRYTCKGDVLFSMVRPYLRNIATVPEDDCIASTGFFVCHPTAVMTPEFCYYLMESSYIVDGLNQFMKGDNSPSINNKNITEWIYPIPPIEEQIRIVTKIQELYATIDSITDALR